MGNRAVITLKSHNADYSKQVGIYVHWNGGRDSIEGFLTYCSLQGFRSPSSESYGWARLTQVIANYFGGDGLSVGVDVCQHLDCDNYDNGVYLINGWEIVGRDHFAGKEQKKYRLVDMVIEIDKAQPSEMQLGEGKIKELLSTEGNASQSVA
jgi:hypothetical protein